MPSLYGFETDEDRNTNADLASPALSSGIELRQVIEPQLKEILNDFYHHHPAHQVDGDHHPKKWNYLIEPLPNGWQTPDIHIEVDIDGAGQPYAQVDITERLTHNKPQLARAIQRIVNGPVLLNGKPID